MIKVLQKIKNTTLALACVCAALLSVASRAEDKPAAYDVVLLAQGDSKIMTIKVVRESNGMGLKDAKDLVESLPKTVKSGLSKEDGEKIVKAFDVYHAKAELRDAKQVVVARTTEEAVAGGKYDVILKSAKNKISAIMIAREMTGLGLADAKKLVESAPVTLKAGLPNEEAQKYKRKLEAAEAEVEIKESGK